MPAWFLKELRKRVQIYFAPETFLWSLRFELGRLEGLLDLACGVEGCAPMDILQKSGVDPAARVLLHLLAEHDVKPDRAVRVRLTENRPHPVEFGHDDSAGQPERGFDRAGNQRRRER